MQNPNFVMFQSAQVAMLLAITLNSREHRPSIEELDNPAYHRGGAVKLGHDGYADPKNIDWTKVLPAIWLVVDNGIYLLSNGANVVMPHVDDMPVVYAEGCNPMLDFHSAHMNAVRLFGRGPKVIVLPIWFWASALSERSETIHLRIDHDGITVVGKPTWLDRLSALVTGRRKLTRDVVKYKCAIDKSDLILTHANAA